MRTAVANLAIAAFAVGMTMVLLEISFRVFPALLPAGVYGAGAWNPELRLNVFGTPVIYNKVRYVRRVPNRDGFMDVDHEVEKPAGVVRVGFFGDSYVQSAQVELDRTFFRLVPGLLEDEEKIETFGFGVSGWGTFQAMRAWEVFGERYDIDVVVYMFVENDLGDQDLEIGGGSGSSMSSLAFVELAEEPPGYRVRWTKDPRDRPLHHRAAKFVQSHSLLAGVIWNRLEMLRRHGLRVRSRAEDTAMTGTARSVPRSTDLPSTWPEVHAHRVQQLAARVLADWNASVTARKRHLVVFYVPRGENQLRGEIRLDQTWFPWLERTCEELGIPLVDPQGALWRRLESEEPVYDDHWTPAGHEVVAEVLADSLRLPTAAAARSESPHGPR